MIKTYICGLTLAAVITLGGCGGESSPPPQGESLPGGISKGSVDLALAVPGAEPVELANIDEYVGERSKTEGPVADADGNVYFSDPYGTKLYKWSPEDGLTIHTEQFIGPNGLGIDKDGNLIGVEAYTRRVSMLDREGRHTVLTDGYKGKKYNEPNDLFLDKKGGIYFSDPYFHVHYEPLEQDVHGMYYITPDRAKVIRVIDDMKDPNGIFSSPDGSLLYVIDSGEQKTFVYTVNPDCTLADKRVFVPWGLDGLTVDAQGNVYLTGGEDVVRVYNSKGEEIGTITVPITRGHTANVCFGGKDNKTLFITAGNSLFSLQMQVSGI